MRIQCREDTTAVHTHYELILLGPRSMRVALAELRYWSPTEGASEKLMPVFEHPAFSLSPSASRVATRFAQHGLSVLEVAESPVVSRSTADVLTFLTDELVLSVRPEGDAQTPRGLFRGRHGANPERIELPAPVTVKWPEGDGRLWKADVPFQTGLLSAGSVMYSNGHGHTVVDSETGIVVCVNRLGTERAVYRLPSEGANSEVKLTATATDVGFITVHHGGRGSGVVNHFAADGKHLGALAVSGNVSDVSVSDGAAFLLREAGDGSGKLELVVASLPALTVMHVVPTRVAASDGYPGLDARDGGRDIWLGNGSRVRRYLRSTRGWEDMPVKLDEIPRVEPTVMTAQEAAKRASAPSAAAPSPASAQRNVVHPKFGTGRVLAEEGKGDQTKLKIEFADGVRTLLARFVRDE
jgi:hypothetical protein